MSSLTRCLLCNDSERSEKLRRYKRDHPGEPLFISSFGQFPCCHECAESRQWRYDRDVKTAQDLFNADAYFRQMPPMPNLDDRTVSQSLEKVQAEVMEGLLDPGKLKRNRQLLATLTHVYEQLDTLASEVTPQDRSMLCAIRCGVKEIVITAYLLSKAYDDAHDAMQSAPKIRIVKREESTTPADVNLASEQRETQS
jgi:hypothetical protein